MTYLNRYKPTSAPRESYRDAHLHTPVGEYDLNWAHGEISVLSTGQLQLRPFIVSDLGLQSRTDISLRFTPRRSCKGSRTR
jgi:hypothetical protein